MSLLSSLALQLRQMLTVEEIENTLVLLRRLYVAQLRELIRPLGLQLSGKRQDLIDRLEQHIRHCQVTGQNVRLLALRTIVLKMMTNDPVPDFDNLYNALQTGLIDQQLMADQLARLQYLANKVKGKPRLSGVSLQSGYGLYPARSGSEQQAIMPYSPQYSGPALVFLASLFYQQQLMVPRFPYIVPPSKGRNLCNIVVRLHGSEIALLQSGENKRLYLFGGLPSDPNPSFADIQFPPIEIHVDGINTKQYVKGLKGKPGTCRPADLTEFVNPSRTFTINIVYSDASEEYALYLYIVDARSPEALVDYFKGKEHISEAATKAAIINDYQQNQDDDIVMATSSLSLRCPLTYARLTTPMRSIECDHVQCFDALSFLTMQERIPSWICPVCSKKINPGHLAISDYILNILHTTSDEVDMVNINTDGSWEPVDEDNAKEDDNARTLNKTHESREASSAPKVDESIEIISLDSDSEEEQPDVTMRSATSEPIRNTPEWASTFQTGDRESTQEVNDEDDEDFDDATITELESALSENSTNKASSNTPATSGAAPTVESATQRHDSISSEDRPIQSHSRRSRFIDVEDEETGEGTEADRLPTATPDGSTRSSDSSNLNETNQTNGNEGNRNASEPKEADHVNERRPLYQPTSSTITSGASAWQIGDVAQLPPPSSPPPARAVPESSDQIHHFASDQPLQLGAPQDSSLNASQIHSAISLTSGTSDSNVNLQTMEIAPEQRTVVEPIAQAVSSSSNPESASRTPGTLTPGRADISAKSPHSEPLDVPKAKRLKIPTDPGYSLIENIAQSLSRPASTDGTSQNSTEQSNTPRLSSETAIRKVGSADPQPNNGTLHGPQEHSGSRRSASSSPRVTSPERQQEHIEVNSMTPTVKGPSHNNAPGPQQGLQTSADLVGAPQTEPHPLEEVRSDLRRMPPALQLEVQRRNDESPVPLTASANQQQQPRSLVELISKEQVREQRLKDVFLRQQSMPRQQQQQQQQQQQREQQHQQQHQLQQWQQHQQHHQDQQSYQPPRSFGHQLQGPQFQAGMSLPSQGQGRMALPQAQSQEYSSLRDANPSNNKANQFRQLVFKSSELISHYKVSNGEDQLGGSPYQQYRQAAGPGNGIAHAQPNGRPFVPPNSSTNIRAHSLSSVTEKCRYNGQSMSPVIGRLTGPQDGQQSKTQPQLFRWAPQSYASPHSVNNQVVYDHVTQRTAAERSTSAYARPDESEATVSFPRNNSSASLPLIAPQVPELARRATTDGSSLPSATAVRYSRSPFEILNENPFAEKVKGLLGIEVQPTLLTSDLPRVSPGSPTSTQFESNASTPASGSTPATSEQRRLPAPSEQTPAAEVSKSASSLDNRIQDMAIATPVSRRVSSDLLPERTWNKKLSRKFNPSEINLSNLIELDDE